METKFKAYLLVKRVADSEVVDRIGVSRLDDFYVERVMSGLLINMSPEYYVDDSEVDAAHAKEPQP